MFAARILLVLCPPVTTKAAVETIARACDTAARPAMLRFALPYTMDGYLVDLPDGVTPLFYDAAQGLNGLLAVLTDETHFLSITGPHGFAPHWDNELLTLARSYGKRTLFTATVSPLAAKNTEKNADDKPKPDARLATLRRVLPVFQKRSAARHSSHGILPHVRHTVSPSPTAAQAYLPALKEVTTDGSVQIGGGLALVCAAAPVPTLIIDPALLFGPVTYLMEEERLDADQVSLSAYLTGFSIFALPKVLLWPLKTLPIRTLRLPPPETLPGTTVARFEQQLGLHGSEHRSGVKAAMGLFSHEDTYVQKMPGTLKLRHKMRAAGMKLLETHMPLMVSAFVDLPNPRVASGFYLLRFGFLRRIVSLPLLLYTGGQQERALRASFPHTQSYPDFTLLPRELLNSGMKADEYFARSKMLLLQRAIKRHAEFTHTAWVDMDVLPHPVCEDAVPNFKPLMDDRIHIATVNGVPDPSFVVVPSELTAPLAKLVHSITLLDAELKRGFGEPLLWERIFQKKPQWFAIHPMPRKRLLFLSAFDPILLSQAHQALLSSLPAPYYATQADVANKSEPEKETSVHA